MYLVINHGWRRLKIDLPRSIGWLATFIFVVVAWVVFRAGNITDARHIIVMMSGLNGFDSSYALLKNPLRTALMIGGALLWVTCLPNTRQIAITRNPKRYIAFAVALAGFISVLHLGNITSFLYFRF
jgi:alginate O-acetyltransferase complex protein AlgI